MPNKCSICSLKNVKQINSMILQPISFRAISRHLWGNDSKRDSLRRHSENCLNLEISILIAEKKIENAIDGYSELQGQLEFAKQLRLAAKDYLSNEDGKIVLIPRDDEIFVIYEDKQDLDKRGNPKKKTDTLDILLERAETGKIEAKRAIIKHLDIRQFALNSISTIDSIVDKFLKIEGLYQRERENKEHLANTVKAIKDYHDQHPETPLEKIIEVFGTARGLKREEIIQQLGGIQ